MWFTHTHTPSALGSSREHAVTNTPSSATSRGHGTWKLGSSLHLRGQAPHFPPYTTVSNPPKSIKLGYLAVLQSACQRLSSFLQSLLFQRVAPGQACIISQAAKALCLAEAPIAPASTWALLFASVWKSLIFLWSI